jgi:nucleoside-diphosphate-sugar epimerase
MDEPIYLLTGVTGATGGAAARELRKQGRRARGLVHKEDARAEALGTPGVGIEVIRADLTDAQDLARVEARRRDDTAIRSARQQCRGGRPGRLRVNGYNLYDERHLKFRR